MLTVDLILFLGNYGNYVAPFTNGDFSGDGFVGAADLIYLLRWWS